MTTTLAQILGLLGEGHVVRLVGDRTADGIVVEAPAAASVAAPGTVTFCGSTARDPAALLAATRASVVLVDGSVDVGDVQLDPDVHALVLCSNARLSFSRLVAALFAPQRPAGVDPSAVVTDSASIGRGTYVGPLCTIGPDVVVGRDCVLKAGSHIASGTVLGDRVFVEECAVLGTEGFGFERDETGRPVRFPQLGRLVIGDDCEIGANTVIDRGGLGDTVVGDHAKIDTLVRVGHNAHIETNAIVTAGAVVGGSSRIGAGSYIGLNAVIRDQVVVGAGAFVAMGAVVIRDVAPGSTVAGCPAKEMPARSQ